MRSLSTNINTKSQSFNENHEQMLELVEKLEKHLVESRFEGKEKHVERARKRGKMLARERIEIILDKDSPFLELLPLLRHQSYLLLHYLKLQLHQVNI